MSAVDLALFSPPATLVQKPVMAATGRAFAVHLHGDLASVEGVWRQLEREGVVTAY